MTSSPWQTIVVFVCVALAVAYLAWRVVRAVRSPSSSGCHSCDGGTTTGIKQKPLVTLDQLSESAPHRPRVGGSDD
jgi:membrane protein implicated in regulation of membrane protease activity